MCASRLVFGVGWQPAEHVRHFLSIAQLCLLMCEHSRVRACTSVHACTHARAQARTHARTHACVCVCARARVSV